MSTINAKVIENVYDEKLFINNKNEGSNSLSKRLSILLYGLVSYTVGCVGLFWLIFSLGGLAPVGLFDLNIHSSIFAIATNAGLITLFGLQHSIMARGSFKNGLCAIYQPQLSDLLIC